MYRLVFGKFYFYELKSVEIYRNLQMSFFKKVSMCLKRDI